MKPRVNLWILVAGLALVLPLVALLAVSFGNDPRAVPSVLEGKPAPAFALVDLDGRPVDLGAFAGRPVVMNFWSTWCQPCKLEHPVLSAAPKAWPDVTFLGVVFQDDEAKVRSYLQRAGAAYPQLLDPGGRVAVDYGVAGVPETYFIDAKGVIAAKHAGPLSRPMLAAYLQPLRGAP